MTENVGRRPDQKFAVICYAVAVAFSTIASVIVQYVVPNEGNLFLYLSYLLPQIGYISVFLIAYCGAYKNKMKSLLQKENVRGTEYALAALIAVGLLLFAVLPNRYTVELFKKIGLEATVVVPTIGEWYDYVLCTGIICVLPAIGEELIFRKAFCDGMENVADHKTILLAGLAFSLSHFNPAQTVHQFVLGCVLATVYVATKNITLPMMMHCINNVLALYLQRWTGTAIWSNIAFTASMCAVGAVAVAIGLWLLLRKRKGLDGKKTGKIEIVTVILIVVLAVAWAAATAVSFRR